MDVHGFSALALVCSSERLFHYLACPELNTSECCYAFRFYKNKYSRYSVLVDTKVPTLSISSTAPTPCFSRTEIANEVWVSMIEKAYAKLNGGYARIAGVSLRDAIQDLCGLEPEIIVLENVNQAHLMQYLKMSQANGSVVGFMLRQEVAVKDVQKEKNRLDALPEMNRVYVFQGVENQEVVIKDPWYQGKDLVVGQKGTVRMNYSSLVGSFNCMVVVKDFPDEWRGVKIDINMTSSNGIPASTNLSWVQNFQYMIQVGVGVPGDMKEVPFHFRLNEIKGVQPQKDFVAGFAVFKAGDKEDKIKTFNQNNLLFLTKPGGSLCFGTRVRDNYSYTIQKLEKKFYSLIPFTNQKGLTSGTYLQFEVFYAGRPSQLAFRFKGDQVLQYAVGESDELPFRILRDKLKTTDLPQFPFNHKNADLALVPGMCKYLILNNPNAAINTT